MKPRMDTRMYTNLLLTAIALLMLLGLARDYGVGLLGSAQAQVTRSGLDAVRRNVDDLERTGTGVVVDSTIPQSQDVAVAAATSEVAASNRDIAAAIRELAMAVREGTGNIKSAMGGSAGASGTAPTATSNPAVVPAERPMIEVAP